MNKYLIVVLCITTFVSFTGFIALENRIVFKNIQTTTRSLKVGDKHKGGYVAYISKQGDPGYDANVQHGLIVAPANLTIGQTGSFKWDSGTPLIKTGATANTLYSGTENTRKIIGTTSNRMTAAKYCNDYRVNGNSDPWYLPTGHEWWLISQVTGGVLDFTGLDRAAANKYGFTQHGYWTSLELSQDQAQIVRLSTSITSASFGNTSKSIAFRVRPVQRF